MVSNHQEILFFVGIKALIGKENLTFQMFVRLTQVLKPERIQPLRNVYPLLRG